MFKRFIKLFNNIRNKNSESNESEHQKHKLDNIVTPDEIDNSIPEFSLDNFPDPYIDGNLESKCSFLIMDDLPETFFLYETDFKRIKKETGIDIPSEFKIVKCAGDDAGFIAKKYIKNSNDELVLAILDITLGKMFKLEDGTIIRCDGVDVAIDIFNKYPECDVRFCSAHRLSRENPEIKKFIDKFENATKFKIEDYFFGKKSNRKEFIIDMYHTYKSKINNK